MKNKDVFLRTAVLSVFIVFLSSCGANYNFKSAKKSEDTGKYQKAIVKYKKFISKYSNNQLCATAQYSIAKIY